MIKRKKLMSTFAIPTIDKFKTFIIVFKLLLLPKVKKYSNDTIPILT